MKKAILILCLQAAMTSAGANQAKIEINLLKLVRGKPGIFISPASKMPAAPLVITRVQKYALVDENDFSFLNISFEQEIPRSWQPAYQPKFTASKNKNRAWLASRQFRPLKEWIKGTKRSKI